ncbi:hypothetical protein KM043_017316 [Ampulex compressa]|nr:hypothetical protein KM043_017316 [Ampulex compressa]
MRQYCPAKLRQKSHGHVMKVKIQCCGKDNEPKEEERSEKEQRAKIQWERQLVFLAPGHLGKTTFSLVPCYSG